MKLFLKIICYTFLTFFVLFWIGIGILSAVGGNSDAWKKRIEGMASDSIGQQVNIQTLHNTRFFPALIFDAEDIIVLPEIVEGVSLPGYQVKKLSFAVPFWSAFWGNPVLETFELSGFRSFSNKNWEVQALKFEPVESDDPTSARLILEAQYNKQPISFEIKSLRDDHGFSFPPNPEFKGSFAEYPVSGVFASKPGELRIDELKLGPDGKEIKGELASSGDQVSFTASYGNSIMNVDLNFDMGGPKPFVSGDFEFPRLSLGEEELVPVEELVATLKKFVPSEEEKVETEVVRFDDLNRADMDVNFKMDALFYEGQELGNLSMPITVKDKKLSIQNIKGILFEGNLSGQAEISIQEEIAELTGSGSLNQISVSMLKPFLKKDISISGPADLSLELTGKGQDGDELLSALNGTLKITSRSTGEVKEISLKESGLLDFLAKESE